MGPQLILFDLDKTLVDLDPGDPHWEEPNSRARDLVLKAGLKIDRDASAHAAYRIALSATGKDSPLTRALDHLLDETEVRLGKLYSKPIFVQQELDRLRKAGHVLGIVTSNGSACLNALASNKSFPLSLFSVVVTRRDAPDTKPSPAPLVAAWREFNARQLPVSGFWFVGDSLWDLEAAQAYDQTRPPVQVTFALVGDRVPASKQPTNRFRDVNDFCGTVSLSTAA